MHQPRRWRRLLMRSSVVVIVLLTTDHQRRWYELKRFCGDGGLLMATATCCVARSRQRQTQSVGLDPLLLSLSSEELSDSGCPTECLAVSDRASKGPSPVTPTLHSPPLSAARGWWTGRRRPSRTTSRHRQQCWRWWHFLRRSSTVVGRRLY